MVCSNCQTSNPAGAKFCMNCGTTLLLTCPNCGTVLPPDARFCFNCGHQMAAEAAPLPAPAPRPSAPPPATSVAPDSARLDAARATPTVEGERRVVTMLFSDVKGSTSMAGQLDPEEWTEIMNGAFEYLTGPVGRYEGTIARLMGDAILAFFGAPVAHEDDPQRAVLAGLEIVNGIQAYRREVKRRYGLDFDVRVGINTGLVVVGDVGSDLRMEYTAMGDAINVAARMEQTAQPGTVQITGDTYRLIAPLFEVEALGGIEVKGKDEAVAAYRVLRTKSDPGRLRGIEGLEAPLVGRDRELAQLFALVECLQQGRGQIVSVMGEAGLGKSRLIAELRSALRVEADNRVQARENAGAGSEIAWLEGRSLSYQTSTPFAPFVDLLGGYFDLSPEQDDAERYRRVRQGVEALFGEGAQGISPFIGALLGIKLEGEDAEWVRYLEPPQLRGAIFRAMVEFFARLAASRPLVLVFDDVHWIDPSSLDLIEQLMGLASQSPLMLIALFRPTEHEPGWRFHQAASGHYPDSYSSIVLTPLDATNARALVASLLHVEDLPEKVRALILAKADGNPFFVEEVIRSLLDAGLVVRENSHWRATREIENISVPNTLAGVITARLDRLDARSKRVAQTAAVIGREFPFEALQEVHEPVEPLDGALSELQQRELIRHKQSVPRHAYLFKHALTQETAYQSLLLRRRRALHRRVAECLERLEPERVNDIAYHFLAAQEDARALPYLIEAGDRAARNYSNREAIGFYRQALEVARTVQDDVLERRAYEGLGSALTQANEISEAVATYQAMLAAARERADIPMQISALNKVAFVTALRLGRFSEAEPLLNEAEQLARDYRDRMGLSEHFLVRCMMCTAAADFDGVVKYMGESVELGRELNIKEQMAMGLEHVATSKLFMTHFEEAWTTAQEGLELCREIGDRLHEAGFLTTVVPFYHVRNGHLARARVVAEEGVALAAKTGLLMGLVYGHWLLGEIARMRGEYERAIASYEEALQAALPVEEFMPFLTVQPLCTLGSLLVEIGGPFKERGVEYLDHGLRLLDHPAGAMGGGTARADQGFAALESGDLTTAYEHFQTGLHHPTMFSLLEKPRYLVGAALVAVAQERVDDAAGHLKEARRFVEERAMRYYDPLLALSEGRVHAVGGEMERAIERFEAAVALASEMRMRPVIWRAEAGAARVLAALGRADEAEAKRQAAHATLQEMADLLTDEVLRAHFVTHTSDRISAIAGRSNPERGG